MLTMVAVTDDTQRPLGGPAVRVEMSDSSGPSDAPAECTLVRVQTAISGLKPS